MVRDSHDDEREKPHRSNFQRLDDRLEFSLNIRSCKTQKIQ